MDIYIPDIKLPKDEPGAFQVIVMYVGADGKLRAECGGTHEVIAVPPHGRLIDADEIPYKKIMFEDDDFYYGVTSPYIDRMPTVIPASKEKEG